MALVAAGLPDFPFWKKYFRVFATTVIPTFGLSMLWAKLPVWLYAIVVAATWLQLAAWIALGLQLLQYFRQHKIHTPASWITVFFYVSAFALTLKFTLQAISVIPALSQLVFGFRPIVIAYLHLVFLGVYSLFFIGYLLRNGYIHNSKPAKYAAFGLLAGVVLNELLLAIQGLAAFSYTPVPYINETLLVVALLIGASVLLLFLATSTKCNYQKSSDGEDECIQIHASQGLSCP
jgi:hypothetical protein